jgi:HemY protein
MRFLILCLAALIAAVVLSGTLLKDTGFVVIGLHGHVIRTSFAFFVILTIVAVALGWWLWRALRGVWRAPRSLRQWSRQRRERKALRDLSDGFLALVQGDWRGAERALSDGARRADDPLLHYLGAARAAQAQQAPDRQAFYLQMAREQGDVARLPVLLNEMEVALQENRLSDARQALQQARDIDSRNDQVLRMELAFRRAAGEWSGILESLPKLAKRGVISGAQMAVFEQEAVDGLLREAEQRGEPAAVKAAWDRIARSRRQAPEIIARYARALNASNQPEEAYKVVLGGLRNHWEAALVNVYGEIKPQDALRQLKNAEDWLREHDNDPALLLTLGRLSLRNGLWGKARSYLEQLLAHSPSPEAFRLLAEAQEQLGDRDAALRCHRQGLLLATGQPTLPLLPTSR